MAIPDDFSVSVSGDIRHVSGTSHYTVLELHRFLQGIADDQSPATANDIVDITSATPSERSTDAIITLINGYNIDDDAAEYFYGGSIKQGSGDTETLYGGLKVLGAVNNSSTQLQVIQNDDYYATTSPFWGDQSGGGYNGNTAAQVLMRILVKCREYGADIDQKRVRVQARQWGDTYEFFNVTLGEGEAVAAISTTPDSQNTTAIATVQGWTGGDIPTNVEGWQEIDINNGDGDQPYYSKWTYNTNSLGMRAVWEHIKEITGNNSPEAATPHGRNGELFLGITHSWTYDTDTGTFTEDEIVYWGTEIDYSDLTGGTFSVGDFVLFKNGTTLVNSGKVLYDNGVDMFVVALEDASGGTLADGYNIEEASAGTVTAVIDVNITDQDAEGGEGVLLAEDATGNNQYIQLIYGVAPVEDLKVTGRSSTAYCEPTNTVTARTIPKVKLGSYTGSLQGAYGVGIDPDDLSSTDRITDLGGTQRIPPNNVTFSLSGVKASEDRILVGKKDTGDDFDWDEMTLAVALDDNGETIVDVGTGNIPADAPASGILRITLNNGKIKYQPYNSHDGDDEFTIPSSDYLSEPAAISNGVMLAFIDKLAAADPEEFTLQFDAQRTLWIRVRDGGTLGDGEAIKTFESQGVLYSTGGSAVVQRISDV
jgi:hypothetical protein